MKGYLSTVAIVLSISIFNMIKFTSAMNKIYGRGPITLHKIHAILKFGFGRPMIFWIQDFYNCILDPDFIIKMISAHK